MIEVDSIHLMRFWSMGPQVDMEDLPQAWVAAIHP
jgi:hypothetical protein